MSFKKPHLKRGVERARRAGCNRLTGWRSGSIRKLLKVLMLVFFPEKQLSSKAVRCWFQGASGPPSPTKEGDLG